MPSFTVWLHSMDAASLLISEQQLLSARQSAAGPSASAPKDASGSVTVPVHASTHAAGTPLLAGEVRATRRGDWGDRSCAARVDTGRAARLRARRVLAERKPGSGRRSVGSPYLAAAHTARRGPEDQSGGKDDPAHPLVHAAGDSTARVAPLSCHPNADGWQLRQRTRQRGFTHQAPGPLLPGAEPLASTLLLRHQ